MYTYCVIHASPKLVYLIGQLVFLHVMCCLDRSVSSAIQHVVHIHTDAQKICIDDESVVSCHAAIPCCSHGLLCCRSPMCGRCTSRGGGTSFQSETASEGKRRGGSGRGRWVWPLGARPRDPLLQLTSHTTPCNHQLLLLPLCMGLHNCYIAFFITDLAISILYLQQHI